MSLADSALDPRDTADHVVATDPYATQATLSGLTDGVLYEVSVAARSMAGNESAPSALASGTPVHVPDQPVERPRGGCGTGAAGPLALAGVAALLARGRRRAR